MKTKLALILLSAILLAFATIQSCKKAILPPPAPVFAGDLSSFYNDYAPQSQFFTIDAGSNNEITADEGTKITFYSNTLVDQNNQPVTGSVDVEVKEIYDKSNMLTGGIGTSTTDGVILESGGMVYIHPTQGSNTLKLTNGSFVDIKMPVKASTPNYNMQVYYGSSSNGRVEWTAADTDSTSIVIGQDSLYNNYTFYYYFNSYNFNWINTDHPPTELLSSPRTEIKAVVPAAFSNSCTGFVFFNGLNATTKFFVVDTNLSIPIQLPIGLDITLVCFGKLDDQFFGAIQEVTVTDGMEVDLNMKAMTEKSFMSQVGALN